MDMAEGTQLQKAVENVMRHYPVDTSQKAVDWASLAGVLAMLYGTRWGAYMMRKHAERRPSTVSYSMASAPAGKPNGSGRPAPVPQPMQHFGEAATIVEADFENE